MYFDIVVLAFLVSAFIKGCEGGYQPFKSSLSLRSNTNRVDDIMNKVRSGGYKSAKKKSTSSIQDAALSNDTQSVTGEKPKQITDSITDTSATSASSGSNDGAPRNKTTPFIGTLARASRLKVSHNPTLYETKDSANSNSIAHYNPPTYGISISQESRYKPEQSGDSRLSRTQGKDWLRSKYENGVSQSKPEILQSPDVGGGCNVGNRIVQVGDQWSERGICGLFSCKVNHFRVLHVECPTLTYQEGSGCVVTEQDLDLDFPQCCPKLKCDTKDRNFAKQQPPQSLQHNILPTQKIKTGF